MTAIGRGLLWLSLLALTAWSSLAIYYSDLRSASLRAALAVAFLAGAAAVLVWVRPWRRAGLLLLAAGGAVLVWWLFIPPSNDRDWQPDVAVLASARREGERVTIENVRNNEYRTETDYTPRFETRTYDLAALRTADLFIAQWGSPLIAHTIMSFGFDDGRHLAISIETRKSKGEDYSAVKGFFKQYELIYVVADERDVVRLRTNYRGEDVFLYRLRASPESVRQVFLDYLEEINRLADRPQWYNALTHNCTTAIRGHVQPYAGGGWSWKIYLNGYLDELIYDRGAVDTTLTLDVLRDRSRINTRAKIADRDPEFSRRIREGMPAR
jgi:Domain of unknown function (DUF4105)